VLLFVVFFCWCDPTHASRTSNDWSLRLLAVHRRIRSSDTADGHCVPLRLNKKEEEEEELQ
jgi:hypothetical protein